MIFLTINFQPKSETIDHGGPPRMPSATDRRPVFEFLNEGGNKSPTSGQTLIL